MTTTFLWARSLGISTDDAPTTPSCTAALYTRSAHEIAVRALLVQGVVAVAFGVPATPVLSWFERQRIARHLTARENAYLLSPGVAPERERLAFQWQKEAEWTLLWAVGRVPSLGLPTRGCDARYLVDSILPAPGASIRPYLKAARLRSPGQLLAEDYRTYNLWCAVAKARRINQSLPSDLMPEVLYQRRYAFEWLGSTSSWDSITCDA